MRRITRFGLPIATLVLLAGAALLIARNLQDFTPRSTRLAVSAAPSQTPRHSVAASIRAVSSGAAQSGTPLRSPVSVPATTKGSTNLGTSDPPKSASGSARASHRDVSQAAHYIYAHGISSAPRTTHPFFLESAVASNGLQYGTTRNDGLFVSTDHGKTWEERSNGLPLRIIYPFTNDPIDTLTSLGVDPGNGNRVAVTTETHVYLSSDAGRTWQNIPVHKPVGNADFITSVALSPFDSRTIAIGTSFAGFFVTANDGKKWVAHASDLEFIYRGAGFYEEIAGLSFSAAHPGMYYIGVGFGGGVYRSGTNGRNWSALDFPGKNNEVITSLNVHRVDPKNQSAGWSLDVASQTRDWSLDLAGGVWHDLGAAPQPPPPSPAAEKRMKEASGRSGIYISPWQASGSRLDHWISFLKANGLNTLVVDVKDDRGHITYDTQVPLAHTLGAIHPYFNIHTLIRKAHENGIYVVGRFVVFKDLYLYRYENHRYAIWDPKRDAPWGHFVTEVSKKTGKVTKVQKEFWVDPFSEFAWRYNLSIARELQRDGIDEIQFDYIRFPSEESSHSAFYRFRRRGMTEENALESFLKLARAELSIPIGVDLFGFNSWYPITGWVGQDIEVYSNYADVICPMFYPSLFPRDFLKHMAYMPRAKYLYREGIWRSQRIIDGRAIVRTFVQAFLLGKYEINMDKAQYSHYLHMELDGVLAAHATGFMLWNFGTDYYMVTSPLTKYVPKSRAGILN